MKTKILKQTTLCTQEFNNLKSKLLNLISKFLDKIFIIIKMNSSYIKNNTLTFIILISLVATILIRLDLIIPIINKFLPYEFELSLRLTSVLYSVLSVFISIISIKSFSTLTIRKYNYKNDIDYKTFSLYTLYFIYILLVNSILYIINYKSISSLNIDHLILIYIFLSVISLIIGLYYILYKFEFKIDLNKTISLTGKICLFTIFTIYLTFFLGLKTGFFINYFSETNFIVKTIMCESTDDIGNINDKLSDDSKINLSNSSNISNTANTHAAVGNTNTQFINNNNTGTISNVNNTQTPVSNNNSTSVTATITKKFTKEYSNNNEFTKLTMEEEFTSSFNKNTSNNNSIEKLIKDSLGIFTNHKPMSQKSFDIQEPINDSFSTINRNFLGIDANNTLAVIRPKTPSINTLSSINESPISPTSTLNINKKLPELPKSELQTNISDSDLNSKNFTTHKSKKNSFLIRKMKSLPALIKRPYTDSLIIHLDETWNNYGIVINDNNEIVIPDNIKSLNSNQLKLNDNHELFIKNIDNLFTNFDDKLFNEYNLKNYFWIEYDAKKNNHKGFAFIEIIGNSKIHSFIGAKNKYELISYLNSDKHKINGFYSKRNIDMKLTLQKNISDKSLWTFNTWCEILNKSNLTKKM